MHAHIPLGVCDVEGGRRDGDGVVGTVERRADAAKVVYVREDDHAQHDEHQHQHGDVHLFPVGKGVHKAHHAQHGEQHGGKTGQAHAGALYLSGGVGHVHQVQGVHQEGDDQRHQGYHLGPALDGHEELPPGLLQPRGEPLPKGLFLALIRHAHSPFLMALVVSLSKKCLRLKENVTVSPAL